VQSGSWSTSAKYEKTAQVIERENPSWVISAGDLSNSLGSASNYAQFHKAWGKFKGKILSVPGNHDYMTDGANPFFDYFGASAGVRGKGYYAKDVGAWTVIGLNWYANGQKGFKAGDEQMRWLDETMKKKPVGRPVLFFAHPPRYTRCANCGYENAGKVSVVWDVMLKYRGDVKIYIAGHANGIYERWVPMNNVKQASATGIRQFIVATGGAGPYKTGVASGLCEAAANAYGAMRLVLRQDGYDWEYKTIPGITYTEKGSFNFTK
jgi:3',5'-cyclic AMP phosphodiesterase CpdA